MNLKRINKALILILKVSIIALAFYFIYYKLVTDNKIIWSDFETKIKNKFSFWIIILLLLFSILNRYLEILKWKNLVLSIVPISTYEATKQVLGALTAGIVTPNGIGEYAGKALFYEKIKTKKIILLNLVCNGVQMIFTVFFGLIGLFFLEYYQFGFTIIGIGIILYLIITFIKKFKIKGYSLSVLFEKINKIPKKIHQKNILLGFLRYLVFSHQYYILFLIFDVHLPYLTLMSTIAVVYFLASSLPSFQMFDFAVKGSVALFFFGKFDINEWTIIFISTLMWFLNVVLPVIWGSFYVLNFKSKWK
ncbi:hypothetical protein [Flavobacterium capsici]